MSTETTTASTRTRTVALTTAMSRVSWRDVVGLAVPMIVLTVLAIRELGAESFWRDEIASVIFAKASVRELATLIDRDRDKVGLANMAAYYLILHFWLAIGETEERIRLLSVIAGVLTVVPVYFVARRIGGWLAGALAAGCFVLIPYVIQHSQEARGYSMAMLATAALTWLVLIGVERRTIWPWLAYGLVAAVGLYVHFFVALVIASHGLWLLGTRQVPGWRASLAAGVPIAVAVIPIPLVIAEYGGGHGWIGVLKLEQVVTTVTRLVGSPLLLAAVLGLTVAAVIGRWSDRRVWLLVGAAFLPIIVTVIVSLVKPLMVPRYLVVSLPAMAVLVGCGLMAMRGYWRMAAVVTVTVALLVSVPQAYGDNHKQDWRGAADWIGQAYVPGDRLMVRGWGRRPLEYYLGRDHAASWPAFTGAWDAVENPDINRIWLTVGGDYHGKLPPLPPAIAEAYHVVEYRSFSDRVTVVLLERGST